MARSYNGPALIPERISRLSKDKRGYPIPWNVLRAEDGTPFFTVNDERQDMDRRYARDLCPICGERLGRVALVRRRYASPAFDENGWYPRSAGASGVHRLRAGDDARISAAPKYLGRIDVVNPVKLPARGADPA